MFYSTTTFLLLVTVTVISLVRSAPVTNGTIDSCDDRFYPAGQCSGIIESNGTCQESKFNLGNTNISTCISVELFWSYPIDNLTITIETPFTKKQQAYTIYINNEKLQGAIAHIFRVFNGQETEVTTTDKRLIQYSDANYQVILKFQTPPTPVYLGVFINYEVTKMYSH
jgi:hypothetical protein